MEGRLYCIILWRMCFQELFERLPAPFPKISLTKEREWGCERNAKFLREDGGGFRCTFEVGRDDDIKLLFLQFPRKITRLLPAIFIQRQIDL